MPTYASAARVVAGQGNWRHTFTAQARVTPSIVQWRHTFTATVRAQSSPARWVLIVNTNTITRWSTQTRLYVSASYSGSKGSSSRPASGLLFPARRR